MLVSDEIIIGHCNICMRDSETIRLTRYSFNEPKRIIDWDSKKIESNNPRALNIVICGTDLNLIAKIRRESKTKISPSQLLERAKIYRNMYPIQKKYTG